MPMAVDRAASTAAGIFTKVGQITTSAWVVAATSGENFSKKEDVSAADLYIFQLPAITGFRMLLQNSNRLSACSRMAVQRKPRPSRSARHGTLNIAVH